MCALAESPTVYEKSVDQNRETAYKRVYKALEGIKSMVFCNGALAIKISNADPTMLALCPLHLTLTQKAGRVSVLFVRPGVIAQGSKAEAPVKELEEKVIKAIESGLNAAQ